MKAQWQLMDVETKKCITIGKELELVDYIKFLFDGNNSICWEDAMILFGDPADKTPMGVLDIRSKPEFS